jgi:hypothetical protein
VGWSYRWGVAQSRPRETEAFQVLECSAFLGSLDQDFAVLNSSGGHSPVQSLVVIFKDASGPERAICSYVLQPLGAYCRESIGSQMQPLSWKKFG